MLISAVSQFYYVNKDWYQAVLIMAKHKDQLRLMETSSISRYLYLWSDDVTWLVDHQNTVGTILQEGDMKICTIFMATNAMQWHLLPIQCWDISVWGGVWVQEVDQQKRFHLSDRHETRNNSVLFFCLLSVSIDSPSFVNWLWWLTHIQSFFSMCLTLTCWDCSSSSTFSLRSCF